VCPIRIYDDQRSIPQFLKEFNKKVGVYISKDRNKIPVFIELVRESPALAFLASNISSFVSDKIKKNEKVKLTEKKHDNNFTIMG